MSKIEKPNLLPPKPLNPNQSITPTLSADHERLIGRIIVTWSKLEDAMQDTLWTLLDLSMENGRLVTARLDAKYKINMMDALGKRQLSHQELDYFSETVKFIRNLYDERNIAAHGVWGTLEPDGVPIVASLKFSTDKLEGFGGEHVISQHFPEQRMLDFISGAQRMIEAIVNVRHALTSRRRSS